MYNRVSYLTFALRIDNHTQVLVSQFTLRPTEAVFVKRIVNY